MLALGSGGLRAKACGVPPSASNQSSRLSLSRIVTRQIRERVPTRPRNSHGILLYIPIPICGSRERAGAKVDGKEEEEEQETRDYFDHLSPSPFLPLPTQVVGVPSSLVKSERTRAKLDGTKDRSFFLIVHHVVAVPRAIFSAVIGRLRLPPFSTTFL